MSSAPTTSTIDISAADAFSASKDVLTAKYTDAFAWAQWAAGMLNNDIANINSKLGTDVSTTALQSVITAINSIASYTAPTGITYTAPTAPTMEAIPGYTAPTMPDLTAVPTYTAPDALSLPSMPTYVAPSLGTIRGVPSVDSITVPDVPSTAISWSNTAFSDGLLDALKAKLQADISSQSTGLGTAETAMFARETARQNATRALAYNEITTQFSSRGFDMPPGALLQKQTEINNESGIRLSDSSSQIMAESARLAVDYNKTVITSSGQILDIIGRLFDSNIMRSFEAAKQQVMMTIDGFKATLALYQTRAELNKVAIEATTAANNSTVNVFQAEMTGQIEPMKAVAQVDQALVSAYTAEISAQIEPMKAIAQVDQALVSVFTAEVSAQVEPIKAIAGANQATASAYATEVQGAVGNLNAQILPEELKIKGKDLEVRAGSTKADLMMKEANLVIETAVRQLTLEVQTLQALAQSASQMVASAINSISVSSSFGFSASASDQNNLNMERTGDTYQSKNISA